VGWLAGLAAFSGLPYAIGRLRPGGVIKYLLYGTVAVAGVALFAIVLSGGGLQRGG